MRPPRLATIIRAVVALLSSAQWLGAQTPVGTMKVTPISDLRPDWLNVGDESPNGRFFVFRSFPGDSMVRYDRVTKQWATAPGVTLGAQVRWSPDGRFLAYARNNKQLQKRTVFILPMDTVTGMPRGFERRINTKPASWPAWSPEIGRAHV